MSRTTRTGWTTTKRNRKENRLGPPGGNEVHAPQFHSFPDRGLLGPRALPCPRAERPAPAGPSRQGAEGKGKDQD